jgi:hypothetical protein
MPAPANIHHQHTALTQIRHAMMIHRSRRRRFSSREGDVWNSVFLIAGKGVAVLFQNSGL